MSEIGPNRWSIECFYSQLELVGLKAGVNRVLERQEQHFPKPINGVWCSVVTPDGRKEGDCDLERINAAIDQYGDNIIYFTLKLYHRESTPNLQIPHIPTIYLEFTVDFVRKRFKAEIATVGMANAKSLMQLLTADIGLINIDLPSEHRYLETFVSGLASDYPNIEKNIFLIMRFQDQKPFPEIVKSIRNTCEGYGLSILRADDRQYTDDLWDNVMTYMYGCAAAIAVFDQINYRDFNPNVALEVGFMLAQRKPVLLLKDKAITALPSDIIGKVYRPFDTYDPTTTIPPQVQRWLNDRGFSAKEPPNTYETLAIKGRKLR